MNSTLTLFVWVEYYFLHYYSNGQFCQHCSSLAMQVSSANSVNTTHHYQFCQHYLSLPTWSSLLTWLISVDYFYFPTLSANSPLKFSPNSLCFFLLRFSLKSIQLHSCMIYWLVNTITFTWLMNFIWTWYAADMNYYIWLELVLTWLILHGAKCTWS